MVNPRKCIKTKEEFVVEYLYNRLTKHIIDNGIVNLDNNSICVNSLYDKNLEAVICKVKSLFHNSRRLIINLVGVEYTISILFAIFAQYVDQVELLPIHIIDMKYR